MKMPWESLIDNISSLAGEFIEDKDKKAEYANNALKMTNDLALKLLDTKTYPWVDALVKLAYAGNVLVTGLFRPVGTFLMTAFAAWCYYQGHPLPEPLNSIFSSAFAGWGISRHIEKNKKLGPPSA